MKIATALLAGSLLVAAEPDALSPAQAEVFQQKLLTIVQQGSTDASQPRRTVVTETEVNSYLRFKTADSLPVGVGEPTLSIQGPGRLSGRAVVDLDEVRKKKSSRGWLDPTSYLTGRLPITAAGVLRTSDGGGRFELERAEIGGVPIPKTLLQEIVSYYTRSADRPNGVSIDESFELPANIRRIDVEPGRAVIVQ